MIYSHELLNLKNQSSRLFAPMKAKHGVMGNGSEQLPSKDIKVYITSLKDMILL